MTFWQAALFLLLVIAATLTLHWLEGRRMECLLREIGELRSDNRALMEALVRDAGKPLIFKPPVTEDSEGWFDPALPPKPEEPPVRQY